MSNAIIAFDFEERPMRTIERKGEPWFVLADICRALDISNPTQVAARLDDDERAMFNIGRQGETTIVNESGLYTVIMRSKGAATHGTPAWRFRRWVTHDVLPSIRKKGFYGERSTVRAVQARNAMQNQAMRIVQKLKVTRHVAERRMLWDMLNSACNELGIATPMLSEIGQDQAAVPDILTRFWSLFDNLEADGVAVNLHRNKAMVAINVPQIRQLFLDRDISFIFDKDFRDAMKQSTDPRFIKAASVNCKDGKVRDCLVFERSIV